MNIAIVDPEKAEDIAGLAVCLTNEIIERTGIRHFDVDVPRTVRLCEGYIRNGQYTVIAAFDRDRIVGFGALCESHSLYAEGSFGILQEFYVLPEYRSKGIGKRLLDRFVEFTRDKHWKRLELCTPPVPAFDRTVAFYQAGGYKMKRLIT